MPAEKRSFEDALEPIMYWDATFTIAVFVEEDYFHEECAAFRQRFDEEGTLSAVSDFVYNELAFYLLRDWSLGVKGEISREGIYDYLDESADRTR
ncbi:hypothetical protein HYR99_28550 [Candidatus Poribacteria bacterium]|nr:hypothetical protein [Candidatus Poribacteria bacterium]